uniref:Signal recognition particle 14 kDa protein n=1 Tax=Monodon monoceros TaxID=40151 RepID=A0A8C6B0S5_MONMO
MVLLESEQFLTELTRLFQKCRLSGSVFITLKKYDGRTKPIPRKGSVEGFEPSDNKCLLRATDGKKKISTVVSSKEVNKFQMVSVWCPLRLVSQGESQHDDQWFRLLFRLTALL